MTQDLDGELTDICSATLTQDLDGELTDICWEARRSTVGVLLKAVCDDTADLGRASSVTVTQAAKQESRA